MFRSHIMNRSDLQVRSISRCLNAFVYCSDCVIKSIEIRGILFSLLLLLLASYCFELYFICLDVCVCVNPPARCCIVFVPKKIHTIFSRPVSETGTFCVDQICSPLSRGGFKPHPHFRTFSDRAMSYLTLLLTSFPFKLSLLGGAGYLGYILPSPPPLLCSPSPSTKQQESTQESYTSNAHSYTQPTSHQDHETYSHHKTQKS